MKNRIYVYNLSEQIVDTSKASQFYDLHFFEGEIEKYALYISQGIVLFDPEKKLIGVEFDYYRSPLIITRNQLKSIISAEDFLAYLDLNFGRKRLVNPKQFEIIAGSVVKSKVEPHLGPGYVESFDHDQIRVNFPKAEQYYNRTSIICHKSTLRVISHIKEIQNDNR